MRRLLLLALLLLAAPAAAQAPLDSLVPPSPTPAGFIADGGPVLDAAALARLNARIAEVQRITGGDIGVAILRDLQDRAPGDVGVAIYRAWRIGAVDSLGSARRDLGALLLIVPKELAPAGRGECWITTGRGAEPSVTDGDAGTICRTAVIPRLRERDYAGAVAAGVEGLAAHFAEATAQSRSAGDAPAGPRPLVDVPDDDARTLFVGLGGGGAGVAGLAGLALLLDRRRRRRPRPCPGGHGMMTRLDELADDVALTPGQRTEERIGSIDYDVWACPACDERSIIPYRRWSGHEGCPKCRHRTLEKRRRTLRSASTEHPGSEEIVLTCQHCRWHERTLRVLPRLTVAAGGGGSAFGGGSGWGGGGGGGGGSSFGGSGATGGGGGGGSY